jgi:hypothetical protein
VIGIKLQQAKAMIWNLDALNLKSNASSVGNDEKDEIFRHLVRSGESTKIDSK